MEYGPVARMVCDLGGYVEDVSELVGGDGDALGAGTDLVLRHDGTVARVSVTISRRVMWGRSMLEKAVAKIVSTFGVETKARLAGVGEPEEALRVPIDHLMTAIGALIGQKTELDGEAHLSDISSRPDFAVRVKGAVVGYLEVKQSGLSLAPSSFKFHNKDQWNRLKDLPNLIYTNGSEWRLYRGETEPVIVAQLGGEPLDLAGAGC